jgi:hypothetical protein
MMEPLIQQTMFHPAKLKSVFKHTVSPSSSGFLTIHPATYPVAPVGDGAVEQVTPEPVLALLPVVLVY